MSAVLAETHASPLVSIQIWVESGSANEGKHLGSGISHLLEHQVFKGTEELDGERLNRRVPELGGSWNAYTAADRTVFHINGPSNAWRDFLHLLVQLVFHPSFPMDEFERERDVIRREMDMVNDRPGLAAYYALLQTAYKVRRERIPTIGRLDAFDALSYDDMVAYHRERYVPGNAFVCAAGDISPEDLFAAVDGEMAGIRPAEAPQQAAVTEPQQWGCRVFRREFEQPASTLMLAWRIPQADNADMARLSVLASALGDGRGALLRKKFHDTLGLAHDIGACVIPSRSGDGLFVIDAEVERDRRDELRDAVLKYVQNLRYIDLGKYPSRVCRRMRFARLSGLTKVSNAAAELGTAWHLTRNVDFMREWDEALGRVIGLDLNAAAFAYLKPGTVCEVSVDPVGTNAETGGPSDTSETGPVNVHKFDNGLRLATKVDRRAPVVYATVAVQAGCPYESAGNAGIGTLMAECMTKGTESRSSRDIADAVDDLGGSLSVSAGNNTVSFSIEGLADDSEALLEILADVVLHPSFPEDAVAREREAQVSAVRSDMEAPVGRAFRRVRSLCFGNASYGNNPDGTVESVQSLTRKDLMDHHAGLVRAGNVTVSVVGDIDQDRIRDMVGRLFADRIQPGFGPYSAVTPEQAAADVHEAGGKEQSVVVLAVPSCTVGDAFEAEQMLFCEWCRDMSGPLFTEIREKRGLAYYVKATAMPGMDSGCLFFHMGTDLGKCSDARTVLEHTINRLGADGMPADALERSRAALLHSLAAGAQSGRDVCLGMAVDEAVGVGAGHEDEIAGRIREVTVEDMARYMEKVLVPANTRTWFTLEGRGKEA